MSQFRDTLNLPKTKFPMKASLVVQEPKTLDFWDQIQLYKKLRDQSKGRPKYIVHDGPPYANARPHLGTALNKVLKDIVVKSKILSGFDAPFVPGWDCHGLPIELQIEKKQGRAGAKISKHAFRQACRAYATTQVAIQKQDFIRLGVHADWEQPYLTMQHSYEANAVRALGKLLAEGHLQRGEKPVHWCTQCASALAEAEVDYKNKTSDAIDVAFEVVDGAAFAKLCATPLAAQVVVPIWTTTPWTLPANEAVTVHPDHSYAVVTTPQTVFVVAASLVEPVMARYSQATYEVVQLLQGEQLEGLLLQHPLHARTVPVVLGHHVTTDAGTGNVHTAPAHGQDDYVVGQRYQIKWRNHVAANSCFFDDVPDVGGLHVFKANPVVIEKLQQSGRLLAHESIEHSYPHCWRHKTPLIFRAAPQWFLAFAGQPLQRRTLAAIKQTQWLPAWGERRITSMVENRPDWCISRQRVWGIPIALFIDKDTGALHPQMPALIEKVAQCIEEQGIEGWFEAPIETFLTAKESARYVKVTDTLDVWFDSGVSHACVLARRPELSQTADLYFEGSDQHRGWFQSSLITSLAMGQGAPYKTVLTHGYVVDGRGHKMSKSIGNVVGADQVCSQKGADILRLWVASTDYTADIPYSEEVIGRVSDAYRRIRNTVRFLLSNLYDFDPKTDSCAPEQRVAIDTWAIERTQEIQGAVLQAYETFQFQSIYQKIVNFCSVDLGSFYLDILKDRLYTCQAKGLARRSAQTALYHITQALVHWLAPILSFTAEEIWQCLPERTTESVFLSQWPAQGPAIQADPGPWSWWQQLRQAVNKILERKRLEGAMGSALDAQLILYVADAHLDAMTQKGDELRFFLMTSSVEVQPLAGKPESVVQVMVEGVYAHIEVSNDEKCQRCWQRRPSVAAHEHQLCARCVNNLSEVGEQRLFA